MQRLQNLQWRALRSFRPKYLGSARIRTTHVLRSPQSNPCDTLDMLQPELGDGLARLLLVPAVDGDGCTGGDVGLAALLAGVGAVVLLNLGLGVLRLIGELLDAWVGHVG